MTKDEALWQLVDNWRQEADQMQSQQAANMLDKAATDLYWVLAHYKYIDTNSGKTTPRMHTPPFNDVK